MTAEEKVKKVYPKAYVRIGIGASIYLQQGMTCVTLGFSGVARESWAWADAWRRIEAQRKAEGRE